MYNFYLKEYVNAPYMAINSLVWVWLLPVWRQSYNMQYGKGNIQNTDAYMQI